MSKGDQPIENYLQSLTPEQGPDSGGAFTINPEKARAKLGEFALEQPHHYTGALVSALIRAGASFVDVEADSDDFILTSDLFLTRVELQQLFSLASDKATNDHFFRLALGLQASLAGEPQLVLLESWDGREGGALRLSREKIEVGALPNPGWTDRRIRSRIHVRDKPGLRVAARYLKKVLRNSATPEQQYLRDQFRLASTPIRLNNESLNDPPDFSDCTAVIQIGEDLPSGLRPRLSGEVFKLLPAEGFTAYLGYRDRDPGQPLTELVVAGMTVSGWDFDIADRAVIYCDSLVTDLSFGKLVRNTDFQQLETTLLRLVQELLPELLEGPLRNQNRFPTRVGDLSYGELLEFYRRHGFLTVVGPDYVGKEYGDAPLVLGGTRFLRALFPNQVVDEQIPNLVPPGEYRARIPSEKGPELALTWEPQATMDPVFPRRIVHAGPQPKIEDVLRLYEAAGDLEQIGLEEGLELLSFVLTYHVPYSRDLKALMNDASSPFGMDPESYLSRLVAKLGLPTQGGEVVSLETLANGRSPGECRVVYTDHPLRFEPPPKDTVLLPVAHLDGLWRVVGLSNIRMRQELRSGLIDRDGSWVSEPEAVFFGDRVCCGRLKFRHLELWGFTDENGVPVMPPRYLEAMDFQEGTAAVSAAQDDFRVVNTEGTALTGAYDRIFELRDGLRLATRRGRWGYLDQAGEVAIDFDLESGGHFGEGQALATRAGKKVFIDRSGGVIAACPVEADLIGPLQYGLRLAKKNGLFGFLNQQGEWMVEPRFQMCWNSNGQVIPVQNTEGAWGLIDHRGEQVAPFEYTWMDTTFGEGLIAVGKEGSFGFLDSQGRMVLSGFQRCCAFSQGLAPAQRERWGYIDKSGDFHIPPTFLSARPFSENRAVVGP